MLNINNQAFVTLKIDGTELEYANIKNITLAEGNGVMAPTIKIELDDPKSYLSKSHALSEGNTIDILVTRSIKDTKSKVRKYRLFGVTRENASYNANLAIVGILNAPLYFVASARESHVGTTSSVLSAVATKCGLKYNGPSKGRTLNDRQIWLDVATTRAKFVFDVARHGWMDSKSCMGSTVTSYGELRYKNMIDEINMPDSSIKFVLTHSTYETGKDSKTHYIVKEARDKSSAGVMATWTNYGASRGNNNIDGVQKTMKDLPVHSPSQSLALNKEVIDMVKRVRFEYAPIDSTNTHKEYQNALYQNVKLSALFTESMSLLISDVSDIQLFDMLIYRQADADPKAKVRNEDKYLVTGKTIVIRGGIHYAERIQCTRMSLTMTGKAPMASNMSDTSQPSLVPESSINLGAIGQGLMALNGLKDMSGAISAIASAANNIFGSAKANKAVNDHVVEDVAHVKREFVRPGVTDSEIRTAIGVVAAGASVIASQQGSNAASASVVASGASTVANATTPKGPKTAAAMSAGAAALAAAATAEAATAAAAATKAASWKAWKDAQDRVGKAKPGPEKAAAMIASQNAYNSYYDTAGKCDNIERANQAAIWAGKDAQTKIDNAAMLDAKNAPPVPKPNAVELSKAALSKPGGCVDACASTIKSATDANKALVECWSLVGETPTKYMVSPEVKALTESCTAANDRCKEAMALGVKTANLVMSAVAKVAPPTPMPPGNSATMAAMSTLITKPGVTAGQISQFFNSTIGNMKSGSPDWLYYNNIAMAWSKSWVYDGSVVKPL